MVYKMGFSKCGPPAAPRKLLEMQIIRLYPRPTESETLGTGLSNQCFNKPSRTHRKVWEALLCMGEFLDPFIMLWQGFTLQLLPWTNHLHIWRTNNGERGIWIRKTHFNCNSSSVHQWGKRLQFISSTRLLVLVIMALDESISTVSEF